MKRPSIEAIIYLTISLLTFIALLVTVGLWSYIRGDSLGPVNSALLIVNGSVTITFLILFIYRSFGHSLIIKLPREGQSSFEYATYMALGAAGAVVVLVIYVYSFINEMDIMDLPGYIIFFFVVAAVILLLGWNLAVANSAGISFQEKLYRVELAPHRKDEWLYLFMFILGLISVYGFLLYQSGLNKDINQYGVSEIIFLIFMIFVSFGGLVFYLVSLKGITDPLKVDANIVSRGEGGEDNIDEAITSIGQAITIGGGGGGGPGGGPGGAPSAVGASAASGADSKSKQSGQSKSSRQTYPFTAIVGQETMKKALLLNAINPEVGGVLIRGQKGTAKSTAVRGLSEILPEIEVVDGCRFSCDPHDTKKLCWECKERLKKYGTLPVKKRPMRIVDLPLNATEDRVVGSFDLEEVLKHGMQKFEPGILAEANRGILYVDEINLLDDYLVDVLLDAAAMSVVTVEREGVSVSYPARFAIVGSMNPEEGELRPQLLDRIALQVEVKGIHDPDERIKVISYRKEFNANPEAFVKKWLPEQEKLRKKVEKAQSLLDKVTMPLELLKTIAKICIDFNVDGHRADIIIEAVSRTIAAFEGRTRVTIDDIIEAAELALPHRMRRQPFEEAEFSSDLLRTMVKGEQEE